MWEVVSSENEWGGNLGCGLKQGSSFGGSRCLDFVAKHQDGLLVAGQEEELSSSPGVWDSAGLWGFGAEKAFEVGRLRPRDLSTDVGLSCVEH